jgi:hypothetical protein
MILKVSVKLIIVSVKPALNISKSKKSKVLSAVDIYPKLILVTKS